jgi:hypothetical protein
MKHANNRQQEHCERGLLGEGSTMTTTRMPARHFSSISSQCESLQLRWAVSALRQRCVETTRFVYRKAWRDVMCSPCGVVVFAMKSCCGRSHPFTVGMKAAPVGGTRTNILDVKQSPWTDEKSTRCTVSGKHNVGLRT